MEIPVTDIIHLLERYNGMAMPKLVQSEAGPPIAGDPLASGDPEIRAAAEALARHACASDAA